MQIKKELINNEMLSTAQASPVKVKIMFFNIFKTDTQQINISVMNRKDSKTHFFFLNLFKALTDNNAGN